MATVGGVFAVEQFEQLQRFASRSGENFVGGGDKAKAQLLRDERPTSTGNFKIHFWCRTVRGRI